MRTIIWRVIYIRLMAALMMERTLKTGIASNAYQAESASQARLVSGLQDLFRRELLYVGRWRQETAVRENWRAMRPIWKREVDGEQRENN